MDLFEAARSHMLESQLRPNKVIDDLVLSAFAGASRELLEAIIVNPFDPSALGEAFFQALTMSREEQRERMRRMREVVRFVNWKLLA